MPGWLAWAGGRGRARRRPGRRACRPQAGVFCLGAGTPASGRRHCAGWRVLSFMRWIRGSGLLQCGQAGSRNFWCSAQAKTTGRCQILRHGPPWSCWAEVPSPARQEGQNLGEVMNSQESGRGRRPRSGKERAIGGYRCCQDDRVSVATSPVVSLVSRAKTSAWGGAMSSSSLRATWLWWKPLAQPAMRVRCSGGRLRR